LPSFGKLRYAAQSGRQHHRQHGAECVVVVTANKTRQRQQIRWQWRAAPIYRVQRLQTFQRQVGVVRQFDQDANQPAVTERHFHTTTDIVGMSVERQIIEQTIERRIESDPGNRQMRDRCRLGGDR
jgi:hypothetical protein